MDSLPHVKGISHRYVKANGVSLHVAEAGTGDPLVLLHGWPQHWYMWRYQIPLLSKKFRVICPDLRGFGWSEATKSGYKKEELADDILSLLDVLNIKKTYLAGHDWGGWIGFLMCLREPDRIKKFIALNIPHPFQKLDSRLLTLWRFWYQMVLATPYLGTWILRDKTHFIKNGLSKAVVQKKWSDDELAVYSERFNDPARAWATTQLYRTNLIVETLPILFGKYHHQRLKTETLILFGKDDHVLSTKLLTNYERYADNLKIEFVDKCGHFIAEDCPDIVLQRMLKFF